MSKENNQYRYFLTYSGVELPLKLVSPIELNETENRNTYFRAYYDTANRMIHCQKIVYDEIEFEHNYEYYDEGMIRQAHIVDMDDEEKTIQFSQQGDMQIV